MSSRYLTVEAEGDAALQDDLRARAIAALVAAKAASWVALLASRGPAPALFARVAVEGAALVTSCVGLATVALLARRRFRAARVSVMVLAGAVVLAWTAAKGEVLAPPSLTLESSKAHAATLRFLLVAVALGSVILLPSLFLLFRIFGPRGRAAPRSPSRPA